MLSIRSVSGFFTMTIVSTIFSLSTAQTQMDRRSMRPTTFAEHLENARRHASNGFDGFDQNHDGTLGFDEFLDKTWRLYNTYADPGGHVSELQFVECFLGPANDPISGPAVVSQRAEPYRQLFRKMDRNHKGFITKEDIIPHVRDEFAALDSNKDGSISLKELGGR